VSSAEAFRAVVAGRVQGVGFRDATLRRARELGVMGWVRNGEDDTVAVHAEGERAALEALAAFLRDGPAHARVEHVAVEPVKVEGHEQFAIRGVSAGAFVVEEHRGVRPQFVLRLEVGGAMRSWTLPKGPSLDPAVKRMALEAGAAAGDDDGPIVWDRGVYEQGGRVAWPEALERGHAVFVLHGEKLHGGFALQRTGQRGTGQWLLIKRRDDHARPGWDVVAERPEPRT
jgi:DNA ligase D-like protein (predicted 3'-phosphoesterase)